MPSANAPRPYKYGNEAVRLDPVNAEARLHLGGVLAAEKRWRDAAEHLSVGAVLACRHTTRMAPAVVGVAPGWRA